MRQDDQTKILREMALNNRYDRKSDAWYPKKKTKPMPTKPKALKRLDKKVGRIAKKSGG